MGPLSIFVAVVVAILLTLILTGLCIRLCKRKAPVSLANVARTAQDLAWTWITFPVSYKRQCSTQQQQLNNNIPPEECDKHVLDTTGSDISVKECDGTAGEKSPPAATVYCVTITNEKTPETEENCKAEKNNCNLSRLHDVV